MKLILAIIIGVLFYVYLLVMLAFVFVVLILLIPIAFIVQFINLIRVKIFKMEPMDFVGSTMNKGKGFMDAKARMKQQMNQNPKNNKESQPDISSTEDVIDIEDTKGE